MKRKGLYALIALALGGMGAVHAQETYDYDGRWYFAPWAGAYYNDTDRNTDSFGAYGGIGFGRYFGPNASVDFFLDRVNRDRDGTLNGNGLRLDDGGKWPSTTVGVSGRWYFGAPDAWRPYLMAGVGASFHNPDGADQDYSAIVQGGVGIAKSITDNVDFRSELAYRYDFDDSTQPSENGYGDWMLGVGLAVKIGEPPAPPPPPAEAAPPPQPSCDQLDDDNDGVNNCDDKCPGTEAGTIVGPDGCPQKVTIDLRGVNFKFDRPKPGETDIAPTLQEPTSDSMSILDQAVDTLKRYPQVPVEVAGHTDSIGTDAYNQKLSERRAQIVYDYLTAHGIDASRLQGPVGYGENRPIDTNETAAGRARNRRTELNVEGQDNGSMDNGNQ